MVAVKHHSRPSRSDSDWRVAKALKNFKGFIFVYSDSTIPDLERKIFGLPACYKELVRAIRIGMLLFVFNYSNRCLYGVFEAASDGGFNIDPYAWENTDPSKSGRYSSRVSKYPAQVRVRIRAHISALDEETFRPILDYVEGHMELTAQKVQQLLALFDASHSSEREFLAGRNRVNCYSPAIGSRDPESPRSACKSDSDCYSDCSSRGMNSGEDELIDEALYEGDDEGSISERLSHVDLDDSRSYDKGRFEMPAASEAHLGICYYTGQEMAWKGSQKAAHCSGSDCDNSMSFRLHDNDPAVNNNSNNSLQTGVHPSLTVNRQDDALTMPMVLCQMQFPFTCNKNVIFIPVQTVQCHMTSIIPRPPACPPPITAGFVEALHYEILQFARWTRPLSEIQLHVEAAIDCVRKGVKMVWPEADVEVFGSFATGLCLQHSDVDLAVVDAPRIPSSESLSIAQASASLIRELAVALKTYEWCESINPLDTASMPVLKCLCRPFGTSANTPITTPSIAVDITIGGMRDSYFSWNPAAGVMDTADQVPRPGKSTPRHTGGEAREYVLHKIRELPALAPLVLLLKSFLHHKDLSNVYSGGLGSFSLTLLVAFYLERVPIPRNMFVDGSTSDSPTSLSTSSPLSYSSEFSDDSDALSSSGSGRSLGERFVRRAADAIERVLSLWDQGGSPHLGTFLLGFLQTFGFELDLSREKIVLKGTDGSPGGMFKRDDRHVALWIDDPLRPGINIGAGSYGMVHVQTAFQEMLQVLTERLEFIPPLQCDDKDCQDLAAIVRLPDLSRLIVQADDY